MKGIFVATYFNTAILVLLINANLSETILSFIPLDGQYADLTENWYMDIGPALISTMIFNAIFVYLEQGGKWLLMIVLRLLDTSCYKKDKTRMNTIQ